MNRLLKISRYLNHHRLESSQSSWVREQYAVLSTALKIARIERADKKVICNACGWSGQQFLDFHSGYDHVYRNAICAGCLSHPRHRSYNFVIKNIFASIGASKKIRVLHFAPELQIEQLLRAFPQVDYLSVDIDYRRAMRREDITALSFPDNAFDVIICIHVFEHIDNDKRAMQEVCRVLKPGGVALLDVPIDETRSETFEDPTITDPAERTKAYWQWDHVRLYGNDYGQKLAAAGFEVEKRYLIKELGEEAVKRHGLEVVPNYICRKRQQ